MDRNILKIGIDPILHFEAVARLQGLKRAADELKLSQPAVTHSLNRLEQSLGVLLCVRTRSHFALTEAGRRLFEVSSEIKLRLRRFQSYLSNQESFDGMFNVGIIDNINNKPFELALSRTIQQFPKMKVNIQVFPADVIQDQVASGELDIGIGLFRRRRNMSYDVVGTETICHYISDQHSLWKKSNVTKSDLVGLSLTWLDIISRNRIALETEIFRGDPRPPMKVVSYANNLHAATFILASGRSIVPFPFGYLETRGLSFKFRPLDKAITPYNLNQSIVSCKEFADASPPTGFFVEQIRLLKK